MFFLLFQFPIAIHQLPTSAFRLLTVYSRLPHTFICAAPPRMVIKLVLRARAFRTELSCVRRIVGAPTTNARPGNGSHHPENLSAGRGRPPRQLPGALVRQSSWRRRWRPALKEPLRLHARSPFSRTALVRRKRNARLGPHPAMRADRVVQQVAERL